MVSVSARERVVSLCTVGLDVSLSVWLSFRIAMTDLEKLTAYIYGVRRVSTVADATRGSDERSTVRARHPGRRARGTYRTP